MGPGRGVAGTMSASPRIVPVLCLRASCTAVLADLRLGDLGRATCAEDDAVRGVITGRGVSGGELWRVLRGEFGGELARELWREPPGDWGVRGVWIWRMEVLALDLLDLVNNGLLKSGAYALVETRSATRNTVINL